MPAEAPRTPEQTLPEPDLLIVLGRNIATGYSPERIRSEPDHLSNESRMNAAAAGVLYRPGMKILFSGGRTAGEDLPSEAEAMREYMLERFPDVPEDDILLDNEAVDTAGNAEGAAEILSANPESYRRVGLLGVGYHVPNARRIFERYGIKVERQFASEDVIGGISREQEDYVDRWSRQRRIRAERGKEMIRSLILEVDPDGRMLRKITQRSRK